MHLHGRKRRQSKKDTIVSEEKTLITKYGRLEELPRVIVVLFLFFSLATDLQEEAYIEARKSFGYEISYFEGNIAKDGPVVLRF